MLGYNLADRNDRATLGGLGRAFAVRISTAYCTVANGSGRAFEVVLRDYYVGSSNLPRTVAVFDELYVGTIEQEIQRGNLTDDTIITECVVNNDGKHIGYLHEKVVDYHNGNVGTYIDDSVISWDKNSRINPIHGRVEKIPKIMKHVIHSHTNLLAYNKAILIC